VITKNGKDFPEEVSMDIENLKQNEWTLYALTEKRVYKIVKLSEDQGIQENVKSHVKRALRRVSPQSAQATPPNKQNPDDNESPQDKASPQDKEGTPDKEIPENKEKTEDKEPGNGENDSSVCVICFSEQRTHILLPCGHYCLCQGCSKELQECPICRVPVTSIHQVFQA